MRGGIAQSATSEEAAIGVFQGDLCSGCGDDVGQVTDPGNEVIVLGGRKPGNAAAEGLPEDLEAFAEGIGGAGVVGE